MTTKKQGQLNKKPNQNMLSLAGLEENIGEITSKYYSKIENHDKIDIFREKYQKLLNGKYVDLLLTIKEFPDFNLFDYISPDSSGLHSDQLKHKEERKKNIILRNNIFLRLLVEAYEARARENLDVNEYENGDDEKVFQDFGFLRSHIESFKNVLCERENSIHLEIDVEVFFLSILGYKDKAKSLIVKFYDYFKTFMKTFNENDNMASGIFNNLEVLLTKGFHSLKTEEIIVLRKIIDNCIKRRFYSGIQFLCSDSNFCFLLAEGRLWKSIIKHFDRETILNVWRRYYDIIRVSDNEDYRITIIEEHKKRLLELNLEEDLQMRKYERNVIDKENKLDFVLEFKDLLVIMFKYSKKDIALFLFEELSKDYVMKPEIFEVCLGYDEDIAM